MEETFSEMVFRISKVLLEQNNQPRPSRVVASPKQIKAYENGTGFLIDSEGRLIIPEVLKENM